MAKLHTISGLATLVLLGLLAMPTYGQAAGGGAADPNAGQNGGGNNNAGGRQRGGNNGGQNGGGRNYDPAARRQQQLDRLKDQLGMTDDEFKAIQPKIEKVMDLQRDAMMARFAGFGGGRNRGGNNGGGGNGGGNAAGGNGGGNAAAGGGGGAPGGQQPESAVAVKTKLLQDLLEDKDAKPEEIKAKLDDLRAEKAKTKDEMTKAQADLRELLSQRQEAVLVTNGMLD